VAWLNDELLQPVPVGLTELAESPPGLVHVPELESELVESLPGDLNVLAGE